MNTCVIGVGSNIDPQANIAKAKELLSQKHLILAESKFVITQPIGIRNQPDFLNGAFLATTPCDVEMLKSHLRDIEVQLGRKGNDHPYGPRPIDLDILVWNDTVVNQDVYERDFVKKTVLELLPQLKI